MLILLSAVNDTVQQRLSLAPDREIQGDTTSVRGASGPGTVGSSSSSSSSDSAIFGLNGQSLGFTLYEGDKGGITWGMLGNATSALYDYVKQCKSSDLRGVNAGVVVGTQQVGKISCV